MGAILGHEMTHGFDSLGRQFDASGNLRDWWTFDDMVRFTEKAKKLIEQANTYEVAPGLMANGPLEVGENMADLGGITLAHEALRDCLEEHPEENVEFEGFTPEQRCFLSWTQNCATKSTEAIDRMLVDNDPQRPRPAGPLPRSSVCPRFTTLSEFRRAIPCGSRPRGESPPGGHGPVRVTGRRNARGPRPRLRICRPKRCAVFRKSLRASSVGRQRLPVSRCHHFSPSRAFARLAMPVVDVSRWSDLAQTQFA